MVHLKRELRPILLQIIGLKIPQKKKTYEDFYFFILLWAKNWERMLKQVKMGHLLLCKVCLSSSNYFPAFFTDCPNIKRLFKRIHLLQIFITFFTKVSKKIKKDWGVGSDKTYLSYTNIPKIEWCSFSGQNSNCPCRQD